MPALDHFPQAQDKFPLPCSPLALKGCAQPRAAPGNLCTPPDTHWKEPNSLLPLSTALKPAQSSSPPLPLLPSRLTSTYSHWAVLHGLHSVSRCCLSASASIAALQAGRMAAVQRSRQHMDLCGHRMLPSVFYSFSNNSYPSASFLAAAKHPADIS